MPMVCKGKEKLKELGNVGILFQVELHQRKENIMGALFIIGDQNS